MTRWILPAFACGLMLAGCSEYDIGEVVTEWPDSAAKPVANVTNEDRIVQVTTPEVDILWVIDDSCSMYDEQQKLTQSFDAFMEYFLGSGLDYHIGVVSTDNDANNKKGKLQSGLGHLYIETETPTPVAVFEAMASLGTSGSGTEKGMLSAFNAIEIQAENNSGFYRETGSLHTVTITDENDQTRQNELAVQEFINWYDGLKEETDQRTYSTIVHIDAPIPPSETKGSVYLTIADAIGGIKYDIKEEEFVDVLEQLGAEAAGLKREFFLSKLPVTSSIDVSVVTNGAVDKKARDEWDYDGNKNSITFREFVPDSLAEVVITYTELASLNGDEEEEREL